MSDRTRVVFICGDDETPGPRSECPDRLHDHPLPDNYIAAQTVAARRLSQRWVSRKCERCRRYGWEKP